MTFDSEIRHCPAMLISAPASGQGKTTITATLAYHHHQRNRKVRVFKIGPDFIDPQILIFASGWPAYQFYAECHGFLYLLDGLSDKEGNSATMVGLLLGIALMQSRLFNLGMHSLQLYFPFNPSVAAGFFQ